MIRAATLSGALFLAACSTGGQQRWIGDVVPRSAGPACEKSRATLTIIGTAVTFAPNEGTWILRGTTDPDGTIQAERTQQGANRQPYETRLEARRTPQTIRGTYTAPRCTYDVNLTPQ